MNKSSKLIVITIMLIVVCVAAVGCSSTPKHNDKATLANLESLTVDMDREQVKEIMGEPFAYDADKVDWDSFGYDTLMYSPNDIEIMEYYKNRTKLALNLPGFSKQYKFTNKTWERKYYFGSYNYDNITSPMTYVLYKVVYKRFKITRIESISYTKGVVGSTIEYSLINDNNS